MMLFRWLEENHADEVAHSNELPAGASGDKPWGPLIGAALCVQMVTLTGLILAALTKLYASRHKNDPALQASLQMLNHVLIPSFAAGALLATASFLIIPESLHLLEKVVAEHHEEEMSTSMNGTEGVAEEEHHEDEDETHLWKFGASILAGFLMPILVGMVFPDGHMRQLGLDHDQNLASEKEDHVVSSEDASLHEEGDPMSKKLTQADNVASSKKVSTDIDDAEPVESPAPQLAPSQQIAKNWKLAAAISIGDFLHNFTDGIFLGNAFLLCTDTVAWTIAAATIYHELAQEVADFAVLTTHCNLLIWEAVILNFVSGFSVIIGAIVIFTANLSSEATGSLLGISAGVYIYIATTECFNRIQNHLRQTSKSMLDSQMGILLFLGLFVLGAVPIGLVLLNHKHCEVEN
jgi:zinc transporter ZupT